MFGIFLFSLIRFVSIGIGGVPVVNAPKGSREVLAELGDIIGFDDDGSDGVVAGV